MKNFCVWLFLLVSVILLVNTACSPLKKMKKNQGLITYTLTPKILEMHGDSVALSITGKFPGKYFGKKVICEIKPVLKTQSGNEIPLTPIKVQGEKVTDNYKVIKYADGGTFNYSTKVGYQDEMKVCDVNIKVTASQKSKTIDFDPVTIGKGTIITPSLIEKEGKMIYAKDNFVRIIPEQKEASILYLINQSNVRPQELTKPEIKELQKYLANLPKNPRKQIKSIDISAYASPDGPEDLNTRLSINRGKTSQDVTKNFTSKIKGINLKDKLNVKNTPEDWEGFQKLMQQSDIPDKDLVLRVLSMYSDPVQREKEIKNMSKVYKEIADKILPKLRRGQIKVNVDSIGRSDEEIVNTFNTNPKLLTIEELIYGATFQKNLNVKKEFYRVATEQYPNDWRGFNNLAIINYLENDINNSKNNLEKAKSLSPGNQTIMNNLGVIALKEGNFTKAEEYFKSAGTSNETRYNMGICLIKKGNYAEAVNYMGNNCSFNAALAKLLSGNLDGASKTIDCSEDKDKDNMYYLKAIIGARQNNSDMVYNNLRAAISKNSKWSSYAKTDMEFEKYFNDDTFKSIVK
ncbi:MAG: hypothetical protein N3A01_09030 [Bacteroidales bacterium]|nr:hypothetical protein [Bacteroidales bacterium]